ncbi:MAG TPA: 2-dehydropantoate 2-reductase, partial [Longimicrobiales bacterium]|nr:2-dehydropantoate 2-reductase [Longimicrobiales bacterium]
PGTLVLPLLNGVDAAERVAQALPGAQVLAGLTYVPANRPRPGVVHQPGPQRRFIFGEVRGPVTERCQRVLAVLRGAGIRAETSDVMARELWSKLMLVAANGGVCAVTGSPIGPVMTDPDTRALYVACCREVGAVAAACGVALEPDAVAHTLAHVEVTPGEMRPSMLQDLEAGHPLELEAMHGTVVRLGREHGVPVPITTFIYAALKLRAGGRPA